MKLMVAYPHGLGDCILATPALRAYKEATGDFVGFVTLERFRDAGLFENNPYVDELLYSCDPWMGFASFQEGCTVVEAQCRGMAAKKGYDQMILIRHSPNHNKILDCAEALGVVLADPHTEVYLHESDWEAAERLTASLPPYGFVQTHTGVIAKDLPEDYGGKWLQCYRGLTDLVEVGKSFRPNDVSINIQFALMAGAEAVCLPDSVFYHACGALEKDVDLAYFARGPQVYERVRPLHPVRQNIVYDLPPVELMPCAF